MVNMQHVSIDSAAESVKRAFLAWKATNEVQQG